MRLKGCSLPLKTLLSNGIHHSAFISMTRTWSRGHASFKRVENIVFYSEDLMPGYTMGFSILIEGRGMDTFENSHRCLPHSLCSIALHTPIFT